nr:uncharacterized protein LOC125993627 [Syngnathus scovelli]
MNYPRGAKRRRTMSLESGESPMAPPGYTDDPAGCNPVEPAGRLSPGTGASTDNDGKNWRNPFFMEEEQEIYVNQEWIALEPIYANAVPVKKDPEPNFESRGATLFADSGYEISSTSPFCNEPPNLPDNPPMDWSTIEWRPSTFPQPAISWKKNLVTDCLTAIILSVILTGILLSFTLWKSAARDDPMEMINIEYDGTKLFNQTCWAVDFGSVTVKWNTSIAPDIATRQYWTSVLRRREKMIALPLEPGAIPRAGDEEERRYKTKREIVSEVTHFPDHLGRVNWTGQIISNISACDMRYFKAPENFANLTISLICKNKREEKIVKRNWILKVGEEHAEWYSNASCVPLPESKGGYWEKSGKRPDEFSFPAPMKNSTCRGTYPGWEPCWSCLDLVCEKTQDYSSKRRLNRVPRSLSDSQKPVFWDCQRVFSRLNACYFNVGQFCENNYHVIMWAYKFQKMKSPVAVSTRGGRKFNPNKEPVDFEFWLNSSFPWLWQVQRQIAVPSSDQGRHRLYPSARHLWVQRLPTPADLLTVTPGEFDKIDQCVVGKIYAGLHGKDWTVGKSPRCDLDEIKRSVLGTRWVHNCASLLVNKTVKGILQAWSEINVRDPAKTWWGFNGYEMKQWVIPCLNVTTNYWVQYQFMSTVYSKETDIKPTGIYSPYIYVNPRPWAMTCNTEKTKCLIALAREQCVTLPNWKEYCLDKYQDERYRSVEGALWEYVSPQNRWRRQPARDRVPCSTWVQNEGLLNLGKPVSIPYRLPALMQIAEGRAFRKSLCEGRQFIGFDWVGPNRIFNNGTCFSPSEHWIKCGHGEYIHDCTWYEKIGAALQSATSAAVEAFGDVISGALEVVLGPIWAWVLVGFALIGIATTLCIAIKGSIKRLLFDPREREGVSS